MLSAVDSIAHDRRRARLAPVARRRRRWRSPSVGTTTSSSTVVSTLDRIAVDAGSRERSPRRRSIVVGDGRRPAREAVLVRDQAAVRLAGARAAHQGAGRRAVRAAARLRRRARGGPDDLGRAAAHPAADGPRDQGPGRRAATSGSPSPRSTRSRRSGRSSRSTASTPAPSPGSRSPRSATQTAAAVAGVRHPARPGARAASSPRRACWRTGRRTTTFSTRSTGCSCRAPTSPPRRWSPGWSSSAGRSTTSRPTARCAPRRRRRRPARRSSPAGSTRCCSRRPRPCATSSASPASRTPPP